MLILNSPEARTVFGLAVDAKGGPGDAQFGGQPGSEVKVAVLGLVRLHEADAREVARVAQPQPLRRERAACHSTPVARSSDAFLHDTCESTSCDQQ